MKKIPEWWHSYRMIAAILAGVRHIFKLHPYNTDINLATGDRQLEWVRNTIGYLEMPKLVRKWVIWRHDRTVDFVNALVMERANRSDGYTEAWAYYNEHVCVEPLENTVLEMKIGETPSAAEASAITREEVYDQTKNLVLQDKPKKGKYEDG